MDSKETDRASNGIHGGLKLAVKTALVLAIVTVTCLGVQQGMARADAPDSLTTWLEPGINYVGWVGGDTPVEEFFAAVPQVEAVFAWSARNQEWLRAAPGVPLEFNTLSWLTPGMGLAVRLGGERPIEWTREFSRASGLIALRSGLNLVAWTGDRATLLSEIERDLQRSFRAQYDDAGANAPDRLYTPDQPETVDAFGRVEHGGALWIRSEVLGSWSQRSDAQLFIRGRVIGPDGEGIEGLYVQATITSRLGWYFPDITDADGSFSMFVLRDSEYTISFQHREGCTSYYREGGTTERLEEATRVDTSEGVEDLEFHVRDGACGRYIRGTLVDAAGEPIARQRVVASAVISGKGRSDWTAGDGSFEIFVTDDTEYELRAEVGDGCSGWYDGDGLTRVREDVSEISVNGADIDGVEIRVPPDLCAWEIHGRVLKYHGAPYPGVQVYPITASHETLRTLRTEEDGSFVLPLPEPGLYRLGARTDHDCSGYYVAGGLVADLEDASAIEVTGGEAAELVLRMPRRSCIWQIRGRLIRANGSPIADTEIAAQPELGGYGYARTSADGSFQVTLGSDGPVTLRASIGGACDVFRTEDGISFRKGDATRFGPAHPQVTNVEFKLPAGVCEARIRGRVVDEEGQPLTGVAVSVWRNDWSSRGVTTQADGSFDTRVAVEGAYFLQFLIGGDCWGYYDGATLSSSRLATPGANAAVARPTDLLIRVPPGLCAQIQGMVLNPDGEPAAGVTVTAESQDRLMHHSKTAADGSFAVKVTSNEVYRVWVTTRDQCQVFYRDEGAAPDSAEGLQVEVGTESVQGIVVRIPATSCVWQIRGNVIRPDGSPHANVTVTAWIAGRGSGVSKRTDENGVFEFTFTDAASRVLAIQLNDRCSVYHHQEDGFSLTNAGATQFSRTGETRLQVEIRIPEGVCEWQLQGRVVDTDGEPVPSVGVRAFGSNRLTNSPGGTPTAADGSFVLLLPIADTYRIDVWFASLCRPKDAEASDNFSLVTRTNVEVANRDVSGVEIQVPAVTCGWRIIGRVVDAIGAGIDGARIRATKSDASSYFAYTTADGSFVIQTGVTDYYHIGVELDPECSGYYDEDKLVANRNDGVPIYASEVNVTGLVIRVPQGFCSE